MAKRKPEVKEKDRHTIQWQKDNQKSQRRTDRQYNGKRITRSPSPEDRQTIQWEKDNQKSQRMTDRQYNGNKDNQKSKRTDRKYNGKKITRSHREGQTDNTMVKR